MADRQAGGQTSRHIDRQADGQTDRQPGGQAAGAAHGAHATSPLIGLKALISPGFFFDRALLKAQTQHTNGF